MLCCGKITVLLGRTKIAVCLISGRVVPVVNARCTEAAGRNSVNNTRDDSCRGGVSPAVCCQLSIHKFVMPDTHQLISDFVIFLWFQLLKTLVVTTAKYKYSNPSSKLQV